MAAPKIKYRCNTAIVKVDHLGLLPKPLRSDYRVSVFLNSVRSAIERSLNEERYVNDRFDFESPAELNRSFRVTAVANSSLQTNYRCVILANCTLVTRGVVELLIPFPATLASRDN